MMDMSQGMYLMPQMQMKASPALIALNRMLVLSTQELQQLVQEELEQNPALEQVESDEALCSRCKRPLNGSTCMYCLQEDLQLADLDRTDSSGVVDNEEFDPLMLVAAPTSLPELLLRDLHVVLPNDQHELANYLVGSLTPQGFLDADLNEIAAVLSLDYQIVEEVLQILQELGPPGVGARNVQECLLLQLDRLDPDIQPPAALRTIIKDYWIDLGEHRYGAIAQSLGIGYDDVVAARDFLREYLRPYPLNIDGKGAIDEDANYLTPDVVIREEGDSFVAEVVESRRFYLRLNPLYQKLSRVSMRGVAEVSSEEHEHLQAFVSRAQLFLTNLRQRRETIRRIAEHLIECQSAYLRNGVRYLVPLTRAEVAAALGVHESTVSRATAGKYVQLPSHKIVPFSTFFTPSLSVKDVIQELVNNEKEPLTDQDLVELLRERGFDIARRTIAKYRNQLGILPSTLR
jgi:RNA polymerase sigma-54 factor